MILPRLLIIDDQYSRDNDERFLLKDSAGIVEITLNEEDVFLSPAILLNYIATAVFCSGQKEISDEIINDYAVIKTVVERGWGEGAKFKWNLVLLDVRFDSGKIKKGGKPAGRSGDDRFGEVVRDLLTRDFPGLPLVMFSSKGQKDITNCETHYLSKDDLGKKELTRCLADYGLLDASQYRDLLELNDDLIGSSPEMISVFRQAYNYATTDDPVIIFGESGAGKENIARYIHKMSSRGDNPFIDVNITALPESLLESELFGVIPNYAGLHNRVVQIGKFEFANHGTLFLDEIGDMPLLSQVKILRAVQERRIQRLGGNQPIELDIRFLSATARDLSSKIAKGEFLKDLLHRLGTLPIVVPPLRDHPDDIIPLAEFFMAECLKQQGKKGINLSDEAKAELKKYPFAENNIRELKNLITLVTITTGNNREIYGVDILRGIDLQRLLLSKKSLTVETLIGSVSDVLQVPPDLLDNNVVKHYPEEYSPSHVGGVPVKELPGIIEHCLVPSEREKLAGIMQAIEERYAILLRRLIGAALKATQGNNNKKRYNYSAAMFNLLGIERTQKEPDFEKMNEVEKARRQIEIDKDNSSKIMKVKRMLSEIIQISNFDQNDLVTLVEEYDDYVKLENNKKNI
jgi:DNA-binding NtrC family response regulator